MEEQLRRAVDAGDFGEAADLLFDLLRDGALLGDQQGRPWERYALTIGQGMLGRWPPRMHPDDYENLDDREAQALDFWEQLLAVVLQVERQCGRQHKGTIHFQRGLLLLAHSAEAGRNAFVAARNEDTASESDDAACMRDAHTVLAFAELVQLHNQPDADRVGWVRFIFAHAFGAEVFRLEVDHGAVGHLIERLSCVDTARTLDTYREMTLAAQHGMQRSAVAMAATVFESLLLDQLEHGVERGPRARRCSLEDLINEASEVGIVPSSPVRTSLHMIRMVRNRLHPGRESRQTWRLTPRIAELARHLLVATTVAWHNVLFGRQQLPIADHFR